MNKKLTTLLLIATVIGSQTVCVNAAEKTITVAIWDNNQLDGLQQIADEWGEENGYKVTGNGCPRGAAYGEKELVNPTRVITSTVRVEAKTARRVPVKTASDIPKGKIYDIMKELDKVTMKAPVAIGDVVIPNVLGLGVDVVACKKVAE